MVITNRLYGLHNHGYYFINRLFMQRLNERKIGFLLVYIYIYIFFLTNEKHYIGYGGKYAEF